MLDFIARALRQYWRPYRWVIADLNGGRGILLQHDGVTIGAVSFAYDDAGRATGIYIMRNPDKLAGLDRAEASGAIA